MIIPLYCNIEHRGEIGDWMNQHEMLGAAAEIGCAYGGFAREVLARWKGKAYHMVDPWAAQSKEVYRENTEGVNYDGYFSDCLKLAQQDPRVNLIRALSVDGANRIADNSLDLAYIDGNHAYDAVRPDIETWYPKVRPGGLIAGHDYGNDTNWPHFCEVKRAVDEFMASREMTFVFTKCGSWWAIKPEEEVPGFR
jgi:hypothetical protein